MTIIQMHDQYVAKHTRDDLPVKRHGNEACFGRS